MVGYTSPTVAIVLCLRLVGLAAPVAAQDGSSPSPLVAAEATASQVAIAAQPTGLATTLDRERRPASLIPLYVSFGALQVLDLHSTWRALNLGAVEANPLMKGLADNEIALLAIKAAGTTIVVYASERIWKKSKWKAVTLMVAANAGMAWVVSRNYRPAH